MRRIFCTSLLTVVSLWAVPLAGYAADSTILVAPIHAVTADGDGALLGSVTVMAAPTPSAGDPAQTAGGIILIPHLEGLPPGVHGFHLHSNPSCAPAPGKDGRMMAAGAAGAHYDPSASGKHEGPLGHGHRGDLPVLTVEADGAAHQAVSAPGLSLSDVTGRALVIHAGGDNYSDDPQPLGGGGGRIACGVIN